MDSLELSEWFLLGARGAAEIDTLIRVYEEVCTARIHPDDVDRIDRTQDRELERLSGTYSRLVELIRKE